MQAQAGDDPRDRITRRSESGRHWLIDGMNLIGSRPDGWWNDPDRATRRLIEELDRYASATGEDVTVVFDRRPSDVRPGPHGAVTVVFASWRGRNAADHEIVRIVVQDRAPDSIRVVTSDRRLAERVREHGASVMSSMTFRRRLESSLPVDGPFGHRATRWPGVRAPTKQALEDRVDGSEPDAYTAQRTFTFTSREEERSMATTLRIGELAEQAGVTTRTIRYYETIGLLHPAEREGGFRTYTDDALRRLHKIDALKKLGLSLEEVATVIDLYFEDPTGVTAKRRVLAILEGHLRETEGKISALEQFRDDLRTNIERIEGFVRSAPRE